QPQRRIARRHRHHMGIKAVDLTRIGTQCPPPHGQRRAHLVGIARRRRVGREDLSDRPLDIGPGRQRSEQRRQDRATERRPVDPVKRPEPARTGPRRARRGGPPWDGAGPGV
ncbi:MAG: hypothetical protein ACK56I_18785, partial [bacterium]